MRETEEESIKKEKKRKMKNYKGITLIALVVTIVVLLILAGVTISMLGGENGIIKQAQEASKKTNEEYAKERIGVEVQGSYGIDGKISIPLLNKNLNHINGITHGGQSLTNNPIIKLPTEVELNGIKVVINGDGTTSESIAGKFYKKETTVTIGSESIQVPGGATISGIPGEYEDIENGIVIYIIPEENRKIDWKADVDENGIVDVQEKYDQFVWVPVPNPVAASDIELANMMSKGKYPMAVEIEGTDSKGKQNYRGVLYNFLLSNDGTKVDITAETWPTNTGYREPDVLDSRDSGTDLSQINGILNTSYNNRTSFEKALQEQYNEMVDKIKIKKGFYVGRYETSGMNNETTTSYNISNEIKVNVVKGTTTGINNVTWYRMYAQQRLYSNKTNINLTSSMIWGSQWDQIMLWMKNVKNDKNTVTTNSYYVVNSVGMGNYPINEDETEKETKILEITGNSENYKVKNIYDLAGNVDDWTLEASTTYDRVVRGQCYSWIKGIDEAKACYRNLAHVFPGQKYQSTGSRATLY